MVTPCRRFTVLEITSGLPDDGKESDERAEERRLRDLRGQVKRARAVVAGTPPGTPRLVETLASDWREAAMFYARFGITEEMFRHGVLASDAPGAGLADAIWHPMRAFTDAGEHTQGVLPSPWAA